MTQRKSTGSKSTRAFRTISEAADELGLQAHVLRFWESKFSEIQPMKRRGGRRFYRPEDIEFIRGIKVLLHREKHPIKDVQKLIRIRGPQSVMELGRSVEQAAMPRRIKDTNLVPGRIKPVIDKPIAQAPETKQTPIRDDDIVRRPGGDDTGRRSSSKNVAEPAPQQAESGVQVNPEDKSNLEDALQRLKKLKSRWQEFT
jgi:DNA-binding transcriptional MerR regulator